MIFGLVIIVPPLLFPTKHIYTMFGTTLLESITSLPYIMIIYGDAVRTSLYGYFANKPSWITLSLPYCIAIIAAVVLITVLLSIRRLRKIAHK